MFDLVIYFLVYFMDGYDKEFGGFCILRIGILIVNFL